MIETDSSESEQFTTATTVGGSAIAPIEADEVLLFRQIAFNDFNRNGSPVYSVLPNERCCVLPNGRGHNWHPPACKISKSIALNKAK